MAFQTDAFQTAFQQAAVTTDITGAGAIEPSNLFGTTVVTSEAVTNVAPPSIVPYLLDEDGAPLLDEDGEPFLLEDLFGFPTVTSEGVASLAVDGFDAGTDFGVQVVTSEGVVSLTVEGFDAAGEFGNPTVTEGEAEPAPEEDAGQTPAGKRKRWVVEIEGRDYLVDTVEDARALLEANRKVTPLPTKKKRTTRVVTLPEVRLEGLPVLKLDGVSVSKRIQQGVPDEVLRAALEALWDEDDLEVILLAA
jgi:hypothetical protein